MIALSFTAQLLDKVYPIISFPSVCCLKNRSCTRAKKLAIPTLTSTGLIQCEQYHDVFIIFLDTQEKFCAGEQSKFPAAGHSLSAQPASQPATAPLSGGESKKLRSNC
jgi:hypothetical protein